jgi:hypothetical protein
MKRFGLIFGIVITLVALVVVIYLLFFRGGPISEEDPAQENPFGDAEAGIATPRDINIPDVGVPTSGAGEEVAPQLFKITDGPVAHGAVVFHVETADLGSSTEATPVIDDTEVRYVDRASGNMYRFRLQARTLERMTSLTLPGIQEAVWASDGSRVFLRYLSTEFGAPRLETYALPANGSEGYLLQPGLSDIIVTSTSSVLSTLSSSNGTVGTKSTLAGTNPSTVFTSPLSMLRVLRAGNSYAAVTKPSALVPGYAFSIGRTGDFTRILGPLSGLSILPNPPGSKYLYSYRENSGVRLALYDSGNQEAVVLPVATIAEKCVWRSDSLVAYCAVPRTLSGTFPDDWYSGEVQTSDRVWKIDLEARVAALEFDPSTVADINFDAVALTLDAEDEVLVFTNRDDGSLWLYDL